MTTTTAHSPPLDHETFTDVLDATRRWALDTLATGHHFETYQALHGAARLIGHDGYYSPGARFYGQVKRALDQLAADGTLVKIGRGQRHPGGAVTGQHAAFYTPEGYAAQEVKAARAVEERRVEAIHWGEVREALHRAGISVDTSGGVSGPPDLDLAAWQALVARLQP